MKIALNNEFFKHSKEFQTRVVTAAKYQPGMENAFIVYCSGIDEGKHHHDAIKFFESKDKALEYIASNPKQYINTECGLKEIPTTYYEPEPVICNRVNGKGDSDYYFPLDEKALISDESMNYEWCGLMEDSWIIQSEDGNVRVWQPGCDLDFFGHDGKDYICEKGSSSVKIAV